MAWGLIYGILTTVFTALMFTAGVWGILAVITTVFSLLWLVPTALCILGIVNAATGKLNQLPVIGKFNIIK